MREAHRLAPLPCGEGMRRGLDPVAEERRLAYVGITRARQSLTSASPNNDGRGGEIISTEPSRFQGTAGGRSGSARAPAAAQGTTDRGSQSLNNLRTLLNAK